MTKSFESGSPQNISQETVDKLKSLMDNDGFSLMRASIMLKIDFKVAKQILFTQNSGGKSLT